MPSCATSPGPDVFLLIPAFFIRQSALPSTGIMKLVLLLPAFCLTRRTCFTGCSQGVRHGQSWNHICPPVPGSEGEFQILWSSESGGQNKQTALRQGLLLGPLWAVFFSGQQVKRTSLNQLIFSF